MSKIYYRPLSLLFGADARRAIAEERGGALGGLSHIAFTEVEVISRGGGTIAREVVGYGTLRDHPALHAISFPRPDFASLAMNATRVMGIVNVTPDSFSDGGLLSDAGAAIAHGQLLAAEKADILDVGGESTRPGSDTVAAKEELHRVIPVIEGLSGHLISIDTRKAEVMAAALYSGATCVNDVSALGHDAMSTAVVASSKASVILMHAQGEPKTMQLNPRYDDVLLDVYDGLAAAVAKAEAAGIARSNICVDPGIGFGKSFAQNFQLMAGLTLFHGLGLPLLVGLSRKGFVGAVSGEKLAANRVHGSVGGALQAAMAGTHILRVHDVKATVQALAMFTASCDPDSVEL